MHATHRRRRAASCLNEGLQPELQRYEMIGLTVTLTLPQ